MFQFIKQEQNQIMLAFARKSVLKGVDITAKLHNGQEIPLHFRSLDGDKIVYTDDKEMIRAQLNLSMKGANAAVYVKAVIYNKELFRDRVTFAPLNGIVIRILEIPDISGLMANYQHKDWWTRPHFNTDIQTLPPKTLSLLWKNNQAFTHLLPVCDSQYRTDLCGSDKGLLIRISAYQGGFAECNTLAFVMSCGSNPFQLAEENVQFAMEASDAGAKPRSKNTYPEILDYLGWCSWDAFYHKVDAEGLLEKSKEFEAHDIPVRWVMIDDGWSEVSGDKRLRSYDAVPGKFPGGLAAVIQEMKQRYGVRWVGVWHTIAGYWGGIDPQGELFESNKAHLYRTNGDAWIPKPDPVSGFGFWHDWHSYLNRQGVDFVKVDSQSAIANFLTDHISIGAAAKAAHTALEASVGLHFNGCIINCMGMASENIWHRPASAVSRNSDDFMPEEKGSFKEHALQNAYNSFYHGHFYWGDWDMYWTDSHDNQQNMILRAVSGGPIYFSDKPGETNAKYIWPIVYRDGRIIRCDQPGQPTADVLLADPVRTPVPLKIWNRVGNSGVLAAFHIHNKDDEVEGSIGSSDIPGLEEKECWVYEYVHQTLFSLHAGERASIKLRPEETALYSIIPKEAGAIPIGLIDKVISADAVTGCWQEDNKTFIRLKEGGSFAFAAVKQPTAVKINGEKAEYTQGKQKELFTLDCRHAGTDVNIEINFN